MLRWAGLREPRTPDYHQVRDANIDRLADAVAAHLNLTAVGRILARDRRTDIFGVAACGRQNGPRSPSPEGNWTLAQGPELRPSDATVPVAKQH